MFSSVVLPEPDGPIIPTNSPLLIVKSMSCSAVNTFPLEPYTFFNCFAWAMIVILVIPPSSFFIPLSYYLSVHVTIEVTYNSSALPYNFVTIVLPFLEK
ncbi:hypothetical protein D3C85_1337570 [compost metagenome]